MSKDFSTLADMGICSRAQALEAYCRSQSVFYPPHPDYVVKSMVKGFKKYWEGNSDLAELADACYLRNTDGLYRYFEQFLGNLHMKNEAVIISQKFVDSFAEFLNLYGQCYTDIRAYDNIPLFKDGGYLWETWKANFQEHYQELRLCKQ